MINRIQAVIFDFDGLLIDSESPAFSAWTEIYQEFGFKLELDLWVKCVGSSEAGFDPVTYLATISGQNLDRKALMARKEAYKGLICDTLDPLPGVIERLEEAQNLGLKIAVASSSGREWVERHLRRLNLFDQFHALKTKDDVERVKPSPDLYLAAAAALGIPPQACLAIEDSLNGVRAARAAGMACLAIPGPITRSLDFAEASARYSSLSEVRFADYLR